MIKRKSVVSDMVLISKNYRYQDLIWFDASTIELFQLPTHKNLYYKEIGLELYLLEGKKRVFEVLSSWLNSRKERLQREEFRLAYRVLCAMFEEDPFPYELAYQTAAREFTPDMYNPFTVKKTIKDVEKVLLLMEEVMPVVEAELAKAEKEQIAALQDFVNQFSKKGNVTVTLSPMLQRFLARELLQQFNPSQYFAPDNKEPFGEVYQGLKTVLYDKK